MSMKSIVRSVVRSAGIYEPASRAWMWFEPRSTRVLRAVAGTNRRLIHDYLASAARPRLHIGCGDNHLRGWLNTELTPRGDEIYLDATRPFPFANDTFALIYSEHMIEHIPYRDAVAMAGECFRVLRPGGTIRLVTPDMAFLRGLLDDRPHPLRSAYFEFYKRHNRMTEPFTATHLVNHFVRAWGHQFIYDAETLLNLLRGAGFVDVTRADLNASSVPELQGLAKLDRMPDGFLAMESLTVEGRKPA
jgi:predicted SAM-dependent methyltransferase